MKQSKLLKKSLAALLAILMVAAMIPMSAFAASAPEGVTAIRVNGKSATWDGEKYVVEAEGQRSSAQVSVSAVVSNEETHVFLKEADEGQVDTGVGLTSVALSKAAEKPETVGTTGTYKFTLLIGASRNTNTPYQLEIQWTETFASRDTGIKAVHNIPDMVGDAVVADGVITIKTKLGATDISSAVFTAIDNGTPVPAANAATNVIIHFTGTDKGNYQTYKENSGSYVLDEDGKVLVSTTEGDKADDAAKVRANLLPAIFEPNTTEGVTMDLAGDTLTVNANGATEKYTLKFVTEDTFTEIKLGDVAGEIDGSTSPATVTFKFPYSDDVTTEAQLKAVADELPLTFKTVSGVTLRYNSNTLTSGSKAVTFAGTSTSEILKVDTNANSKNVTVTTASGGTATFNLIVTAPKASPVAALTAIKIGNSQVVNIEKGQTTVDVTLPAGTSLSTAQNIKVAGLKGTKVDVLGDAGQKVTYVDNNVTKDGIKDTGVLAAFNSAVKVSDKVVYLKVTSPDGKTVVNYTINVKVGTASGIPTLSKLNLVDKTNGDVIATGTINQTSRKVEMTIPYSIAKAGGDWSNIVVVAEASDFASVAFATGTSFSGSAELVSGETIAAHASNSALFGNTFAGIGTNNTATKAVIRLWTGTSVSSAEYPVDYDVVPKSAEVGKQNQVTSAEFTTASKKEDMTAENTFKADVDRDKHIIKVYLPYSVNAELVAGTKPLRLSALGISDFAVLAQVGASTGNVAAATEEVDDYNVVPGTAALGDAIDVNANWNDYLNTDGTLKTANVVTLRAYSEQEWDKIAGKSIVANNAAPQTDEIKAGEFDTKATSQAYSLVAEVEKAETGYALESIASTVDTNVTVSGDVKDASHELTLSVPYSYYRNSDKTFTLNYTASPKATVKINNVELTSDAGSADTKGASKFSFIDGCLAVNGTKLAPNGGPYVITVTAEDGKHSDTWSLAITQIAAQTEASLKSLTVGKTAGVQDAEDETKWTVVVPNGSDLTKQVLSFETVSPLATVRVGSDDFDASKEYNLEKPLTFTVVAEDGVNRKVYTLTATEGEPSTEADVTAVKIGENEGTIVGEAITVVVPEDFDFTAKHAIDVTVSENAAYTVNGEAPAAEYEITADEPITIEVTAQDGETKKTYTLTVTTKVLSSENTITELTVDGAAATAGEEDTFTAEAEDPANVTLELTLPEGATAKVGETEYTAGMTVNATENVTIVVTAEDGTEKTYTLTVTKKTDSNVLDDVDDVASGDWFAPYVADVLERGIMSASHGKFEPGRKVTRAEFAVMMCNLNGVNPDEYANAENPYTDVKKDGWDFKWIMAAVANDWMSGTSSTTFEPGSYVTREQTALIIAKSQGLSKVEAPAELYSDDAKIADWAKGWVYACKEAGLMGYMSQSQKTFAPKSDLTRAQMATILSGIETPSTPENPDDGNNPENPDEGNNPENPDEGNNPENPDEGNNPENPDEGNNPENPDEGNNPENPDEGSNPENPDEGNTPETPDEGSTGEDDTTGGETEAE